MKLGLVSDLHTEFWSGKDAERIGGKIADQLQDADVILLPGDLGVGADGIQIARALFPSKPVFLLAGNHEFYHGDYATVLSELREAATGNVQFLHNEVAEIIIAGTAVRIIGATLWTDFNLYNTPDVSMLLGRRGLNDFRLIWYGGHPLTPQDTVEWHNEQRAWIIETLDRSFDGVTVLMTHHAPVSFGIGPRFIGDELSPCFASRMETVLVRDDLPLVVWGHTHHCVDRTIENTRFVSNQTGYRTNTGTETGEYGQIIELP